ncbi:two-component sensor histidine kinase [Devosia nitrariae]|uniref:Two-component sensor histidine kinase n=1 Tax=Devosia nitrariae TaxID=2071872 RepID=A0ABQ5W659_9HYPH|nr:two-component sensor histidine kinase [Devosia nitrariae]
MAQGGAGRAVAYSRLLLASVALVATYIDPTQPARFSQITYALLAAYVLGAALVVVAERTAPADSRRTLFVHAVDIAVAAVLVFLTEGPTSPFFTFFTLAIVGGTLSWGARGATLTALVLVTAFLGITAFQGATGGDVDFNRAAVRTTYLIVAAVLLAYFGWYRERNEERLQHLAGWLVAAEGEAKDDPELASTLEHAALVLGVRRVLVVWESEADPHLHLALWTGTECLTSQSAEPGGAVVAKEISGRSFYWSRVTGKVVTRRRRARLLAQAPLAHELLEEFGVACISAAPFEAPPYSGTVFMLDPGPFSFELLTLTELVARRIGDRFEHYRLTRELAEASVNRERARLARDLHDGTLQDLTAAGLSLKAMSSRVAPGDKESFTQIVELLGEQQARMRAFVDLMNPKRAAGTHTSLAAVLETSGRALARQWGCRIQTRVEPTSAMVSASRELQLRLIIAEAIANAARHGRASDVRIEARMDDRIFMDVFDNGTNHATTQRRTHGDPAPFSLAQRITEMGGSCRLFVDERGGHLAIELPEA